MGSDLSLSYSLTLDFQQTPFSLKIIICVFIFLPFCCFSFEVHHSAPLKVFYIISRYIMIVEELL